MNENTVLKSSVYVFICGCIISGLLGMLMKDMSYLLGFILGYIINVLVFLIIIQTSKEILRLRKHVLLIVVLTILKLILYSLGYYLSIRLESVSMIGVFLGYFVIKITIYLEAYKHRGGDNNG